jgi:hypothetical protein
MRGRRTTHYCRLCSKSVNRRKPVCPDHLDELVYVQGVLARIERRERELASKRPDPFGIVGREILMTLWVNGERTVGGVARMLSLNEAQVTRVVRQLVKAKVVVLRAGRRGWGRVRLRPEFAEVVDPDLAFRHSDE